MSNRTFICPNFIVCLNKVCFWNHPQDDTTILHLPAWPGRPTSESDLNPLKIRCMKGSGFWIYAADIPRILEIRKYDPSRWYLDGIDMVHDTEKVEDIELVGVTNEE